MSKSKFTPGPFEVVKRTGLWIVCKDNKVIATIHSEYDARLMADASGMLEALRELAGFSDRLQHRRRFERSQKAFDTAYELLNRHGG